MRLKKRFILERGTAALMAGVFLFTNVIASHAGENAFWAERRGAAHRMKPDETRPGKRQSQNPLLAQLPQGLSSSPIGREVIPSFPSSGSGNQLPTLRPSLPKGDMKQWGWLPELVAPFGTILEIHLSSRPNAPLIIHLQDAHEVEESQRNLAGLVGTLHANRGISLVGLEGAVGALDLDPYRSSDSPDLTRGLAEAFMQLGYLTGPEVAGIVAAKPATLWGIEDLSLYRDHIGAFQASEKGRAHIQNKVSTLTAAADEAKEKIYSSALRVMDDRRLAYLAHREPLGEYALALSKSFKGTHAPFPNVGLLLEALKCERTLNFKEVERERLRLVEILVQRLSPVALETLVQESLNYRGGRLAYGIYLGHLRTLCRDTGIGLDSYGPLNDYISYVLLAERIDPNGLLQEMEDLEKTVLMSLAQTADQRRLVTARRNLSLLKKLTLHSLTPAEWKSYQTERDGILDLQNTLAQLLGRPVNKETAITSDTVAPFEMFCKCAMDRNSALVKNLLNKMRGDQARAAVFVAGGFHTEGVTQILRQEGVSYAVVTPRMTKVPDNARPLDVFARAPLPLEKLLAGDVIHLAYAHLTEARGETLSAVPEGPVRQTTLQLGWVAIRNVLESELNKNADSPIVSAFRGLTHISKNPLIFQGPLSGFLFKADVDGNEKQFKVVMAPKNEADGLYEKNGFDESPSLKIDLPVGAQTYEVRIYGAGENQNVKWLSAGYNRLGRYLARSLAALKPTRMLVSILNTKKEIFDLYQQQMDYLVAQEGLLPHRTGIHLAHAERTTALSMIIAERWNLMFPGSMIDVNDPNLILSSAAHDLGKLSPHLAPLFLEDKTYARDSPQYQALHEHEEAAFDVLRGWGLSIPEGAANVLRYVSSLHPNAPAPPVNTADQKLKILAGIGLLSDILDAQLDLHRPYKTEQLRQETLPTPAQMVKEFDGYLQAWDQSADRSDQNLSKQFRQMAVSLLQDDVVLQSIETTFFERAAERYQEHFTAAPMTFLDYQERFLEVLSSVWRFQLYARHTSASQWWPNLIDRTILRGVEGKVRSERLKNLWAALSLVVENDHALLYRLNQLDQSDYGLRTFLAGLKDGNSFPELSPKGAILLFGALEKSIYRGGVLPDVLKRVDPIFRSLFGQRLGYPAARYAVRVIGVPFWEDTFGGFTFRHLLRSTLVPLLLGHLFVSLAGGNFDLGLVSAIVVFLTGRLIYVSDHLRSARKDAGLITLTSTFVALSIALWGGFALMAVLAAYVAALSYHILVNAWLNRWLFQKDHAPGVWKQRLMSALSAVKVKSLLKELPFFVPPVFGAVLAEIVTSGLTPFLSIAFQFTIGMAAAILLWPKFLRHHTNAESDWLKNNPEKSAIDYRIRLFIGFGFICMVTMTLLILLPEVGMAGYANNVFAFPAEIEKALVSVVAGGLLFHGLFNFLGHLLMGSSFVPAMAEIREEGSFSSLTGSNPDQEQNVNAQPAIVVADILRQLNLFSSKDYSLKMDEGPQASLVEILIKALNELPNDSPLWSDVIAMTETLPHKHRSRILDVILDGAGGSSQRMKSFFDWSEAQIRPDYFNANRTRIERFLQLVLRSDEGVSELARRTPRLLELLVVLVKERSFFEIVPALKMMDQMLEVSTELELRGANSVRDILRPPLTDILTQERSELAHNDTHFLALLRFARRIGVDPALCTEECLRRLALVDWFGETFINEMNSGQMGPEEALSLIGPDAESLLEGRSHEPFLSSEEAQARVSRVVAVVRGEKGWERLVDDFHGAIDLAAQVAAAKRLEGAFSNALDLLRAVYGNQQDLVDSLAKLVPSLLTMKPVGFSTSLFMSEGSLREIIRNLTGLGILLDKELTAKWRSLDHIRPVIALERGISQVEVLGYVFPSVLGTWLGKDFLEVRPVNKSWANFVVMSVDPTMIPDEEIRSKSAALRRLLQIDEKGRSRFTALAGVPMTRRDAELLMALVEKMFEAFQVLESKKDSSFVPSPPAWEKVRETIRKGVESLGYEEPISDDLRRQILEVSREADQWDEVGTLHQALNYMHQKGKALFREAAKEAKVNATVQVGGVTMSVANLSGAPLESQGVIVSKELRQFLRALEKPGFGPSGLFELDEAFFNGSIPLGIHSVEFSALVAPPENGGGIRISFLEWRPKEGNALRLAFIEGVLKNLGFKTLVEEGMHLKAFLDMQHGAVSQKQIERALFLVVRALYYTPDLNLKFDAVIQAKREENGLEMREAYAETQREFSDLPDVFLAEESLPFYLSPDVRYAQRLDHSYRTYQAKEMERIKLRARLNHRLSQCGLPPIPETIPFGQGVINDHYTEPLMGAVARGEVLLQDKGPVRNYGYQPVDDLAREVIEATDESIRIASGLGTLDVEPIFRPIGAVGRLTAGEEHWALASGEYLVLRGLSDPDSGRLLYATATLFTQEGVRRRLSLEALTDVLLSEGLTMGPGEEMSGPLRELSESLLRDHPRKEPLPGAIHHGGRISPGAGGTVVGIVTFDRNFYAEPGERGDSILLVNYTTPSDFDAMKSAIATLTLLGNPELHSAITLRELHRPGIILRGARWVTVGGKPRLVLPVQKPHEARQGEDRLWISPGMEVEEFFVEPGSLLLVNGERGVVSLLSGDGVSAVYQQWRELAEHRGSLEKVVERVVGSRQPEALEFALFLAIHDRRVGESNRQELLRLLEESLAEMPSGVQERFYADKVNHLASLVEGADEKLVWLTDLVRWASTLVRISTSLSLIREKYDEIKKTAGILSLPNPSSTHFSSLAREAQARNTRLRTNSRRNISKWAAKKLDVEDLPMVRRVLREAELNGVPVKNRDFQKLAKKGRSLADEKRRKIREEKKWVYGLTKVNRDYRREVGGKFSNLGESEPIIRREGGFVPRAMAVTSDAFDIFLLEQGIKEEYHELDRELDSLYEDPSIIDSEVYGQVQIKSQEMRDLIGEVSIDPERALGKKILKELDTEGLGNVALILRSSGDMEDHRNAAFAGGAKSFSNVSRGNVLKMLPKVWASFWLSRGVAYRAYQGMKQKDVRMAAMIQEMANSEMSGVMLTVNPLTGEDTIVITAGYGLNEGIEKNLVESDEYVARKSDGELIAHPLISRKLKKLIPNPTGEGTLLVDVAPQDQKRQVLSAEQIKWLVRVGNALEGHYNEPRNVEYTFVDGKLEILQDRAVTSVPQGKSRRADRKSKSAGSWLGNVFYKSWIAWMETPVSLDLGHSLAQAMAPFFVMGGIALGFPLDRVVVESVLSGVFAALIFFGPHPLMENTRFGNPGSVRSPLVWALTAWTLPVAALMSFNPFWGLIFAALLTAGHFSANFERGPPKWNLVWEGQSIKSLWLGLLFILSFGLIPDGRAENVVEPDPFRMIAPSSETAVEGLVSFSSNPDAEQAVAGLSEKVRSSLLKIQRSQDLRDGVNNIAASLQEALPHAKETDQLDALYKFVPGFLKPFLDNRIKKNLSPASKSVTGLLPFVVNPALISPEQWMLFAGAVSSLLHGLNNGFASFSGKVLALGGRLSAADHIVVGDLEQRVDVLHRILKAEGLYAANGEISKSIKNGPKIVQVGDFIGRSKGVSAENLPGALASARGVFDLQGKIEAAGGELILLLGNHEYQVLIGSPVGGDFTEEEMKAGPGGSPSEVDQLRELLIEKIKSGHVKLAHVLKQNGEDTLLTHAGVRESMLGTMVQEGFLSDDLLNQVNGGQPLTLKSARNVESFFNGVVKILADKVPSNGGATNFQKEFRTLFNRDFGIFGANGPLSRVARFQDTELAKGFPQIFGHTAGSVVRRQEAPPSPTEDLSSRVAGSNALNVDASVGRGRPIYARVRAKASTQMSEVSGRHDWRKLSTPHFEGEWARPANVWGWIGFVVDRVHLWVEPEEWVQNAAHAAGNIAELVAVHRQFNDHLAHLSRWGVRKPLGGLYRSGFDAVAKGIDAQIGIRQDDWDMYDRVYKRRVEELLAVWKSLGLSSNIGSLLFQLCDENPDFNQKPNKEQGELNLEGTTSPVVRMKEVAINDQTVGLPGIYEVEIHFAQNREGILADVSAVIGAHGFSVLGASVNRIQGSVFDKFWVMSPDPLDGERLRNLVIEIELDIQDLLQGKVSYEEIYEKRMVSDGGYIFQRVPGSEKVVTSVQFSEREYRDYAVRRPGGGSINKTVIRIQAAERIQPGLLHLIARFLFENDLVVGPPAYPIRTRGLSIFDEFSVEPKSVGKALDSERKAQIERDLKALLEKDTITALDFAQPSSVVLTQQETLARSLLGGPAEGPLDLWGYSVEMDHLRVRVEKDRAHLAAQRKALARTLGLGSIASVSVLARAAARSHGRRSTDFEQENEIQLSVRSQIELLLALAYDQGKGDAERAQSSVVETVRVYHEAQKMSDDESSLMAAIETGKEIALELTPAMWEDNSKQISEREKAQWRRLNIISQAVSEGKLKKHVRLIVPDGVTAREVAPVLKSRGLSLRGYYLTKPKSAFRMADGKYSVNKFVSWLAEDAGRLSGSGSIDMYLMDRSEWDWDNLIARIRKNIRLLVDVLPGVVIDATNRLHDDLKRIVAIYVAA